MSKSLAGFVAALWASLPPLLQLLLICQALDIATGVLVAAAKKQVSSKVSYRGITKKALELLLVALAAAAGYSLNLGSILANFVAGFYAAHEAISILENASESGLPIPAKLKAVFRQMQEEDNGGLRSTD